MSDINLSPNRDFPKVNTFTAATARRLSDEKLTFPEMYPHEVAEAFDSDITLGLTEKQVKTLRAEYGDNSALSLPIGFRASLRRQLRDLMPVLLMCASLLFAFFRDDKWLIITAVFVPLSMLVNALLEHSASKTFRSLSHRSSPRAEVIRDGRQSSKYSRSLVPGDIIVLESDMIVPADARIIECASFSVLETPVNGVRESVQKDALFVAKDKKMRYCPNMVYAGSVVTSGKASAIVTATGKNCEINSRKVKDPILALPQYLRTVYRAGRLISLISVFAELILMLTGMLRLSGLADTFLVSLAVGNCALCSTAFSLSVAAEAKGMRDAMKSGVLFRNMDSVSRIAEADTIMCNKDIAFPPATVQLSNVYTCFGMTEYDRQSRSSVTDLIKCMLLCSSLKETVREKKNGKKKKTEKVVTYSGGDHTMAVLRAAAANGLTLEMARNDFYRIEAEFDSTGEACRVLGLVEGKPCVILRGGVENVVTRCAGYRRDGKNYRLDDKAIRRILEDAAVMSKTQVPIAIAMGYTTAETLRDINAEKKLIFLGFVGFHTATRVDAASSVFRFNSAGIDIAVTTDDEYYTSLNLARNACIISSEAEICTGERMRSTEEGLFIADNEKYRLFNGITNEEWLKILKYRNMNDHSVFVGVSDIKETAMIGEASASFALEKKSKDSLLGACDVRFTSDGFDTVEECLKQSKLITKRILNVCQYMTAGFFTLFFWMLFSVTIFGSVPFRFSDAVVFGLFVNPVFCASLAFSPEDRKLLAEKNYMLTPLTVTKGIYISMIYSAIAGLLCFLTPILISASGAYAYSVSVITYVVTMFLFSLMSGSSRSLLLNRFYHNYNFLISFFIGAAVTVLSLYVPSVRNFMGYVYVAPIDAAIALVMPLICFLLIQIALLLLEPKPGKNR